MIEKTIHYCWFGGAPLPELAQKCIASWKHYCPDYKIIEWNESNYDVTKNQYMKEAYEVKKWGFVPDYARLDIIYQHGGIYLDTDVELLKPIDDLLYHRAFMGMERPGIVALGLGFGAEKNHPIIYNLMQQYDKMSFIKSDGNLNLIAAPTHQSAYLKSYGLSDMDTLQILFDDCYIYPTNFFNPYDLDTGKIKPTKNTISIHHYAGSWVSKNNRINTFFYRWINRMFGKRVGNAIRRMKKKIFNFLNGRRS